MQPNSCMAETISDSSLNKAPSSRMWSLRSLALTRSFRHFCISSRRMAADMMMSLFSMMSRLVVLRGKAKDD